ncbi:inositol monophosphatase family protein [Antarcticirhabdus aurantiaca]|uniref:Inositol monophosphatase family protein n=1 Tax=Antarcticirhabdus aurantiaca TaxID=2606717 RepID=A0ACD4NUX8_9HYPH|nr:inositol monophosphatase family protein [Antarcticirhabdus aurantiaca]WAJ30402.1 inositol monophosphatase family protein [Jeongeuplla avenae]
MARSALLNVMIQAAMKAGRALTRDFGEVQNLQVSLKGPADFVSNADRRSEEVLYQELSRARPDWGFVMEERGVVEGRDPEHRWIVDPLDGTTNFLHGIPIFAVSIGLERAGQVVAGVVFNPAMDELYVAERGGGAFLNDRRLRVAARRALPECVIATGIPFMGHGDHPGFLYEARNFMAETAGIRRLGAAALDLCYVAAGRFDGYWENGIKAWDVAAGSIIVREAGGFVTSTDGSAFDLFSGNVACGNELIHKAVLEQLAKANAARRAARGGSAGGVDA